MSMKILTPKNQSSININFFKIHSDKRSLIKLKLSNCLLLSEPNTLYTAAKHLLYADGKLFRPLVTLISCEAVGGNIKQAIDVAVAIELLHVSSLIHDDIIDGDKLRRSKRTVHSIWGTETAIIAGDLLIGKAIEMISKAHHPELIGLIAQAAIETCEGEILERELHNNLETASTKQYLKVVKKKSAALIGTAVESGAIIGGGTKEVVKALSKYGELVGIAFQIRDDVLNIISNELILRKPVKTDLLNKRVNAVVLQMLGKDSVENSVKNAQEMAETFSKKAKSELRKINIPQLRKRDMEAVADFASKRIF